jgi:5-keto-L-gluconate epimerase
MSPDHPPVGRALKLAICVQTDEAPRQVPVALFSGPLAERARKAAAAGADGLELMPVDPAQLDAAAIRGLLAEHGLAAAAIGSGAIAFSAGLTLLHADPVMAEQARSRLAQLIDFAAAAGAPVVTVGSLRGRVSAVGPAGRDELARVLADAARHAGNVGVRIALEPVNRYELDLIHTADEGLAFVAEIGHPALGMVLDTFHMNIEEASRTEPFRRALAAGRLFHVHVGDNNRLPPGRGLIDFAAIVDTLHEGGYRGYLSAELLAQPDGDTAARQTLDHLRPLVARAALSLR